MWLDKFFLKNNFGRFFGKTPPVPVVGNGNAFSSLEKISKEMLLKMAFSALEELEQEAFFDVLPHLDQTNENFSFFVHKERGGYSVLQSHSHTLYDVLMVHLQMERKRRTQDMGGSLYDLKHQKTPLKIFEPFWFALFKSQYKPTPKDLKLFIEDQDVWKLYLEFCRKEADIDTAMREVVLARPATNHGVFLECVRTWVLYGGDIHWKDSNTQAGWGHLCLLGSNGGDISTSLFMLKGFLDHGLADVGPTKECKSVYGLLQDALKKSGEIKVFNLPASCQETIFLLEAREQKDLLNTSLHECLEKKDKRKPSKKM